MTAKRITLLFTLLTVLAPARADVRAFLPGSLAQIEAHHRTQPFLLLLWSPDCPPCLKELAVLGRHTEHLKSDRLVLVAADLGPTDQEIETLLGSFGLSRFESWRFADPFEERLRHAIDPQWFGELPRAYLYANKKRSTHSGTPDQQTLNRWLAALGQSQ
ncbi:MAG: TlpA family protein disulfide reductase [Chromatiales bacterium]|nr:TlpA family protein disulfide reductase [Chromatiales bacterium]